MDELHRLVAVAAVEGQASRPTDLAAQVHDRPAELALTEVDPDQVARVVGDPEQNRGLAAVRRPAADLLGQAQLHELADEVRHSRPGEAGPAGHVRPADQLLVIDRAQDQLTVVGAGLAVSRLLQRRRGHRLSAYFARGIDKVGG